MPTAPTLYSKTDAQRRYSPRIPAFMEAGFNAGLPSWTEDQKKGDTTALILIDYQLDFMDDGRLAVPGANEDVARITDFIYTYADRITSVYASLDTHVPYMIFFPSWWARPRKSTRAAIEHPAPYTPITVASLEAGEWEPLIEPAWSRKYVYALADKAKKDLMIWPYHCLLGTDGHNLHPMLAEALTWLSAARNIQPTLLPKAQDPFTEMYGFLAAEIPNPNNPATHLNTRILDAILKHKRVFVSGEAKSHCVLASEEQLVDYAEKQGDVMSKLGFLMNCTTCISGFEASTDTALAVMAQKGVNMVTTQNAF